jgi:hypothetical protein
MLRLILGLLLTLLVLGNALAFEVGATIRKLDPEKRVAEVFANGRNRTVGIAKDARILDRDGKELPGGLKSPELKEGAEVTLQVEPENGQPVIREIRLGRRAGRPGGAAGPPRTDTSGLKPLTELGRGEYQGFMGGLYPEGKNERPAAHEAAGVALAKKVQPLDPAGKPGPDGRIVLLTVGMSNTSQSSQGFMPLANADPQKNPQVLIVNGAQGGMTAARIQDPEDGRSGTQYWTTVDQRLTAAGVTRAQVQAVWIKQADAGPNQGFPGYAKTLQAELARIVQLLPERFPNVKLAYLSSRTYGGYARTPLNPEPYAYESGFSVKWLIEQQIKGDAVLNYDPAKGRVRAPWLSWGPYLWANGTTKRADGFSYDPGDFGEDGTHQSPSGQRKVGGLLLQFFKSDSTTKGWFLKK